MKRRSLCCPLLLALICACSGGTSDNNSSNVTHATSASSDSAAVRDTISDTIATHDASAAAAVSLLVGYYAAIEAHEYQHAYDAWSDNGRASKLTFEQFKAGFADTQHVHATVGTPGRIEGAAGSRYIEIPVALDATYTDIKEKCFAGSYVLRRTAVTGATLEQMRWHITSATMRAAACPPGPPTP